MSQHWKDVTRENRRGNVIDTTLLFGPDIYHGCEVYRLKNADKLKWLVIFPNGETGRYASLTSAYRDCDWYGGLSDEEK